MLGGGGVGKGTVVRELLARDPKLWLSRSWTTRPRRSGEPADAYVFVERSEFEEAVAAGRFLEWEGRTLGNLYGTPVPEPEPGQDVVLELDVDGAEKIRSLEPSALVLLLVAPSREEQERRLRGRGDADPAVEARLTASVGEEERGRALADAVVVNDDVGQAAAEIQSLINQRRQGEGHATG